MRRFAGVKPGYRHLDHASGTRRWVGYGDPLGLGSGRAIQGRAREAQRTVRAQGGQRRMRQRSATHPTEAVAALVFISASATNQRSLLSAINILNDWRLNTNGMRAKSLRWHDGVSGCPSYVHRFDPQAHVSNSKLAPYPFQLLPSSITQVPCTSTVAIWWSDFPSPTMTWIGRAESRECKAKKWRKIVVHS